MDIDEPEDDQAESNSPRGGYFHDLWDDFKNEIRRAKLFLEVAAVVAGILYTIYTIKMYSANQTAAIAAKNAADTAQQTLVITNRSWIEVTLMPPFDKPIQVNPKTMGKIRSNLKELSFGLKFTNIGKAPIKNIEVIAEAESIRSNEATTFSYGGGSGTGTGIATSVTANIMYPTRDTTIAAIAFAAGSKAGDPNNKAEQVTPELREDFRQARKYIVVYARGTFEDDLGKHWFNFCSWIGLPDKSANYTSRTCVQYNGTGDFKN